MPDQPRGGEVGGRHRPDYQRPTPKRWVQLPPYQWAWIEAQGGRSETIRKLIDEKMKGERNGNV